METNGSCCWEPPPVGLGRHCSGPAKQQLQLDGLKRRYEEGTSIWTISMAPGHEARDGSLLILTVTNHEDRYVAIWMCIRQITPLVGGAMSLALNINTNHAGKVTYTTYQGLVAISALGTPFALLLSQTQKVIRQDGTKIPYMKKTTLGFEARAIWKQLRKCEMLMLIPVFMDIRATTSQVRHCQIFSSTSRCHPNLKNCADQSRIAYFTVRSRSLASFLTAI